ncbi:hypothetical protein [Pseudomonas sp.]|uniref:hypothetical protein n=1 Tax=Pseudomonas sp. TaxID=306 RepID=UPI002915AAEC|nr:hypothetical protein [Pseudomonas sp.]MDU4255988.1 hypothetical protein [Pseudomonas sp.]
MRAIYIATTITALLLSNPIRGESQATTENEKNIICDYKIRGKTLNNIKNIESTTSSRIQTNKISTTIGAGDKNILARINISCYNPIPITTEESTSAKLEIEKGDFGGRYYRIVNWEKEIHGSN